MYWPGAPEGVLGPTGILTAAALTALTTDATSLRTDLIALAEVDNLALFHESAPFTPTTITALVAQNRVATQRRRMRP